MSMYLQNLTDHLITKNRYDETFDQFESRDAHIKHIKIDLIADDVRKMRPETLGKIMCSFEVGDVMASHEELFKHSRFAGNCDDLLRELVATCLAYMIIDRIDPLSGVSSPYKKTRQASRR